MIYYLFFHVLSAIALWKIAEKLKTEPKWFALVPILNIALFLRLAGKPTWWVILFFIPLLNLVTVVVATMALCQRFGLSKWWGLASLVSPVNAGLFLFMAFAPKKGASL